MLIKLSAYRRLHDLGDTWTVVSQININPDGKAALRAACPDLIQALFSDNDLTAQWVSRQVAWGMRQLLTVLDSGNLPDPGAGLRVARQLAVLNHTLIENPGGMVEVTL